jgi:microfibrillar-associated protein 1
MNFFEFDDQENSNNDDQQEIKSVEYKPADERHSLQISNSDSEAIENEMDIQPPIETEQVKDNYFEEPEAPETNDFELNQEEEYKNWSLREIKRLEEEIRKEGKRIVEERKNEEESSESEENIQSITKSKNQKMKFMQKYYHKGAYFEDLNERSQELSRRNYTEPTGLDLVDKEILPASMIARGNDIFKKGRSKWTNLENEDTSSKEPRLLIRNQSNQSNQSGKKRKPVLFSSLNKKVS